MEDLRIRRATKKDVPVFAEYRYRMFMDIEPNKRLSKLRAAFLKRTRDYYSEHIASKNEYNCVAVVDGKIVGCGSVIFSKRPPHIRHLENGFGYILNIYVEKDYRRRGISTTIMKRLHAEAKKRGIRKLGLHASRFGYPVYESLGYRANQRYLEFEIR